MLPWITHDIFHLQVTEEGGLECVVQKKLWRKVCAPFQFPASATSRSFTMKQYYVKLLYDFEQVYFHHYSGPLPVPPIGTHNSSLYASHIA